MEQRSFSKIVVECGDECPSFVEDGYAVAVHKCELCPEEEIAAEDFHSPGIFFPKWCPLLMTEKMHEYSKRQWLSPSGHPSTGSVVAYHGESPWETPETMTILEISDCHNKVRLHRSEKDTLEEFIVKMETLRDVIADFVTHLRQAP